MRTTCTPFSNVIQDLVRFVSFLVYLICEYRVPGKDWDVLFLLSVACIQIISVHPVYVCPKTKYSCIQRTHIYHRRYLYSHIPTKLYNWGGLWLCTAIHIFFLPDDYILRQTPADHFSFVRWPSMHTLL